MSFFKLIFVRPAIKHSTSSGAVGRKMARINIISNFRPFSSQVIYFSYLASLMNLRTMETPIFARQTKRGNGADTYADIAVKNPAMGPKTAAPAMQVTKPGKHGNNDLECLDEHENQRPPQTGAGNKCLERIQ